MSNYVTVTAEVEFDMEDYKMIFLKNCQTKS